MNKRNSPGGAGLSSGQTLTPAQARREAADRVVGRQVLLALRIVAIIAAVLFGVMGMITDPDIGAVESDSLRLWEFTGFAVLGVAGLVAVIVCRRPACRQVYWLTQSIISAGFLPLLMGVVPLFGDLDGILATTVFGVAAVSGATTLILLYVWRTR